MLNKKEKALIDNLNLPQGYLKEKDKRVHCAQKGTSIWRMDLL